MAFGNDDVGCRSDERRNADVSVPLFPSTKLTHFVDHDQFKYLNLNIRQQLQCSFRASCQQTFTQNGPFVK